MAGRAQSQGIKELMTAEKTAAQKIAQARKEKNRRLKAAKDEAQSEIESYRKQREAQFQDQQKKHAGSKDDFAQKTQQETQRKLGQLASDIEVNKDAVIRRLLEMVYEIKPEVHINSRLNKNTATTH